MIPIIAAVGRIAAGQAIKSFGSAAAGKIGQTAAGSVIKEGSSILGNSMMMNSFQSGNDDGRKEGAELRNIYE